MSSRGNADTMIWGYAKIYKFTVSLFHQRHRLKIYPFFVLINKEICWGIRNLIPDFYLFSWKLEKKSGEDADSYQIETSPLICWANQWIGFYIIGTSPKKELISQITYFRPIFHFYFSYKRYRFSDVFRVYNNEQWSETGSEWGTMIMHD